ncbi:MAG TPA: plastocyanin/azurin family copper-binding protein [Thermoleophilaceae bacterium]
MRRALAPATLAALALLSAGCGSGSDSKASIKAVSSVADKGTLRIVIQSLTFEPSVAHGSVGQTVLWSNEDNARHNITYVSGPKFKSSRPIVSPSTTFSIKLTQAGTVHYYCTIHPWMKATIVVAQ